jgi:tRNA threonylcarbamoyladenosine biosynthesis protein TsaE
MVQTTTSEIETARMAGLFAKTLGRGEVVALYGDLGSGKTQFVKGVCKYFNVAQQVTSPTFVLMNRYRGSESGGRELMIFHFDLYRIKNLSEVYDMGYQEFFHGDGICLVEWAEQLESLLPRRRYDVKMSFGKKENERMIAIEAVVRELEVGSKAGVLR